MIKQATFQNFELLNLRSSIPIAQLQYLPSFLNTEEIQRIHQLAAQLEYQSGRILDHREHDPTIIRQSQIRWLKHQEATKWLTDKLTQQIAQLNEASWQFDLYGFNEPLQYTLYHSSHNIKGQYAWHIDMAKDGIASNRKLSFECMLDDEHSGGEFAVQMGPLENKAKLKAGDLIVYPSFLLTRIYPVQKGKRKSIVGWIAGPSFR